MAKRWKKQKAGQQSKRKRKAKPPSGSSTSSAGGTMSGLRGGLKGMFGGKKKDGTPTAASRIMDILLWVAVIVAGYYFVSSRC